MMEKESPLEGHEERGIKVTAKGISIPSNDPKRPLKRRTHETTKKNGLDEKESNDASPSSVGKS